MPTPGCWIEIYEDTEFGGRSLRVHGPAEFHNLQGLPNAGGHDWGDQIGSVKTGPRTWVWVYADDDFGDTRDAIGPSSEISDLGDMEDEIDSMRIFDHNPGD